MRNHQDNSNIELEDENIRNETYTKFYFQSLFNNRNIFN